RTPDAGGGVPRRDPPGAPRDQELLRRSPALSAAPFPGLLPLAAPRSSITLRNTVVDPKLVTEGPGFSSTARRSVERAPKAVDRGPDLGPRAPLSQAVCRPGASQPTPEPATEPDPDPPRRSAERRRRRRVWTR